MRGWGCEKRGASRKYRLDARCGQILARLGNLCTFHEDLCPNHDDQVTLFLPSFLLLYRPSSAKAKSLSGCASGLL